MPTKSARSKNLLKPLLLIMPVLYDGHSLAGINLPYSQANFLYQHISSLHARIDCQYLLSNLENVSLVNFKANLLLWLILRSHKEEVASGFSAGNAIRHHLVLNNRNEFLLNSTCVKHYRCTLECHKRLFYSRR